MKEIIGAFEELIKYYEGERRQPSLHKQRQGLFYSVLPDSLDEVLVVGDLHGDYESLERIIARFISEDTFVVFLGDYVDRGKRQLDVLLKVVQLKLRMPERVILLRGNHETEEMNRYYGFYGSVPEDVYRVAKELFERLDVFAVWPNRFFFVHGGIPRLKSYSLDDLLNERPVEEMLWNDPNPLAGDWWPNPRGIGWLFPKEAVKEFCEGLGVKAVVRGHQMRVDCQAARNENLSFSGRLWTVFSTGSTRDSYYQCQGYVLHLFSCGKTDCSLIWDL